jgi:DNA-binding CsgD family transcriptional regulator
MMVGFSPKETRVAAWVTRGLNVGEIAAKLECSVGVIKNNLKDIYTKTGLSNRVELALWCMTPGVGIMTEKEIVQNWLAAAAQNRLHVGARALSLKECELVAFVLQAVLADMELEAERFLGRLQSSGVRG